jgi:hypothetical protein|tara:strand:+ start:18443 stop:18775 length:333 start_codon:yes stop_codon:yes gene_type:complete
MDRYRAVTEYRFDWRTEREPSCEDIVFWRETGMKDDDEDVDARDGACSIETAMLESLAARWTGQGRLLSRHGCTSPGGSATKKALLRYRCHGACCGSTPALCLAWAGGPR